MSIRPVAKLAPEDRVLIDDLIARYSRAFDHADLDGFLELFIEDGVFESEMTGTFTGKKELGDFFSKLNSQPEFAIRRDGQHWISNFIFTSVEPARVEMWSNFLFLIAPENHVRTSVIGEYEDVFVKQNGEWLFARRYIRISGDLEIAAASP